MVNWQSPATLESDFLAVVKLWHTFDGLYIWEFVTTLDYEWSIIRGRRPYLRTIWLYSLTRIGMFVAVILHMVGFDSSRPVNCQAWVTSLLVFSYLSVGGATLLIAIRTIAIWNKNKIVVMIALGMWLINLSFLVHSAVVYRAIWVPAQGVCATLKTADGSKYNIIVTLGTDVVLLLIMLLGMYHRRLQGGTSSLARLLWKQGIVWLLIATLAEVPPTVLILLNLNDPLNIMFQVPAGITVTIAATRMYRSLTNFCSSSFSQDGPPSRMAPGTNGSTPCPVPLGRMEVAVHTDSEQYGGSPTQASQIGLYLGKDGKLYDKSHELGLDGDVESSGDAGEK